MKTLLQAFADESGMPGEMLEQAINDLDGFVHQNSDGGLAVSRVVFLEVTPGGPCFEVVVTRRRTPDGRVEHTVEKIPIRCPE